MSGRFQRRTISTALVVATLTAVPASAQEQAPPAPSVGLAPSHPGIVTKPVWITLPRPESPPPSVDSPSPLGLVDLTCISQPTGEVTDCTIIYEAQTGAGLGALVLAAIETARMSPRTEDGVPQASPVRFGVRFRSGTLPPLVSQPVPPAPSGEPLLITNPVWARQPMPEYPERAAAQGIERGEVTVNCGFISSGDLMDCRVVKEAPEGVGFGATALAGARRGQLAESIVREAPPGSRVQFVLRYILA